MNDKLICAQASWKASPDILPPGTLLQLRYLRERLSRLQPGRFIEIGPGAGHISALLLSMGWQGTAFDLEDSTIATLKTRFAAQIQQGTYDAITADWLKTKNVGAADLVLSCMVMEHLDDEEERAFISRAGERLVPGGRMISLVPASPAHWGIEDEIAGHYRRYTTDSATRLLETAGWRIDHIAGLTFPVSNALLPLSNFLVRRGEAHKLSLAMLERTKQSGIRDVRMKTKFPSIAGLLLNEHMIYPFHLLQKLFRHSPRAMVLYVEAQPESRPTNVPTEAQAGPLAKT